jgi:ectoine hydroxylase-related dioxygenase (phytanoyl-CoA dioxygenase family)
MLFLTSVDPGEVPQMPHFDAGIYPLGRTIEAETNVVWALDEFTEDNGATRVARGSHRWDASRHPEPDELESVEMPAGSALVYSGNLWHAAGENRSERSRRALISEHVLPWLRPADNHLLDIPIDELSALPIELLRIAGLAPASDYLGFVGGRHPEEWLRDRVRSQS